MKILNLDIESAPAEAYIWDLRTRYVSPEKLKTPKRMLCFAGKWVGVDDVYFWSEWDDGRERMLQEIWNLLNEADAVLHYNGTRFDIPWLNTEFVMAGMNPPSPFAQIDLYRAIRRNFAFMSSSLKSVSGLLGTEKKVGHEGFSLWTKVMEGDRYARLEMESYNVGDVFANEDLYERIRPWIPNHPSFTVIDGKEGCPQCGSAAVEPRGVAYTALSKYPRFLCTDCGKWLRGSRRLSGAELRAI